jgi:hypothetical protein
MADEGRQRRRVSSSGDGGQRRPVDERDVDEGAVREAEDPSRGLGSHKAADPRPHHLAEPGILRRAVTLNPDQATRLHGLGEGSLVLAGRTNDEGLAVERLKGEFVHAIETVTGPEGHDEPVFENGMKVEALRRIPDRRQNGDVDLTRYEALLDRG